MPSPAWLASRQLVTFWLTRQEYADLKAACKAKGVTVAEAMRKAVDLIMKGTNHESQT